MYCVNLDEKWTFRRGFIDSIGALEATAGTEINLPHDGMISTPVSPNAPALSDSGYFVGDVTNYTKYITVPKEWEGDCVGIQFDGAMMNATVEINGCRVALQNYGYAPFYVDLTDYVTFGEENRISVNINTAINSFSRWYTGSGLFRSVKLCHSPRVHIVPDGVYLYTKEIAQDYAFLEAQIEVENSTLQNRLVEITLLLTKEGDTEPSLSSSRVIQVNPCKRETARMALSVMNPALWDADNPNLYQVKVLAKNIGEYRTHFIKSNSPTVDEATTLFGIRTITADSVRGLRINGKTVKLKGGCLHHDNGLLGAVSLYEVEARKVKKLKEVGFNAIRTAHNPPSAALIEACDRIGMYVFDEAFDAWGMGKRSGDYNQYFDSQWQKDLTAFIKRDRSHPSVIMWSTGNEIPERGGLDNGYTLSTQLADAIRKLDNTRPISNGICSLWSGLDDAIAKGKVQLQNYSDDQTNAMWETVTEPFTNGMDIVGYNYMEGLYERDHEMFPERVILGSENFPKEIGYRWPMVEKLPYVIGDFTWTAWDYIGEAGIGKDVYVEADDPCVKNPWSLMPSPGSPYPWRTANDADFDINGNLLPQGKYRSVVWGSNKTHLFSKHPNTFGKTEVMTMWGFPKVLSNWNYAGYEGKPVELVVYSNADEVEIIVNGNSLGKKPVLKEYPMPNSVVFETVYQAGRVEAISYTNGNVISKDVLLTTGAPSQIRLSPEKLDMKADGHDAVFVNVEVLDENGLLIPDASVELYASVSGCAVLAGFGSGNPITDENYTDRTAATYNGRATAIIRSGYEAGKVTLSVSAKGLDTQEIELIIK